MLLAPVKRLRRVQIICPNKRLKSIGLLFNRIQSVVILSRHVAHGSWCTQSGLTPEQCSALLSATWLAFYSRIEDQGCGDFSPLTVVHWRIESGH